MKKLLFILLTLVFLVQCTSQFWIFVSFKINQDYIATTLCINKFEAIPLCKGSCYLEKQLDQDQKQQQKNQDLKLKEINLYCQENTSGVNTRTIRTNSAVIYPYTTTAFKSSAHLLSVFRPPDFHV